MNMLMRKGSLAALGLATAAVLAWQLPAAAAGDAGGNDTSVTSVGQGYGAARGGDRDRDRIHDGECDGTRAGDRDRDRIHDGDCDGDCDGDRDRNRDGDGDRDRGRQRAHGGW